MYSRAHLLIEKDYQALQVDQPWGIEAQPLTDESVFTWTAKIHGLQQTPWEGGVFRLYIKFDEHYKYRPPVICFHTIPFHPNIEPVTGIPCLDFLDDPDQWSDAFTIGYILVAIQNLLSNPVLSKAVNTEAVDMMVNNPHGYKQMVIDCVLASQRLEAGLDPRSDPLSRLTAPRTADRPSPKPLNNQPILKLSFSDYHRTWTGIATSKPRPDAHHPLLSLLQADPALEKIHCSLSPDQLEAYMARQLDSHNALMYGKFDSKSHNKELEHKARIAKIEKMRKIYLPVREVSKVCESWPPGPQTTSRLDDLSGGEADDLINWTSQLDAGQL